MINRFHVSRRSFIKNCAITAAATGLPLWFIERDLAEAADQPAPALPTPNDRPNIALIGCGGMGTGDGQNASRYGNLVAICDVDQTHLDAVAKRYARNGAEPDKYTDFRKIMERDDIHIVINSTPDHWHTLINIAAAKARKDVYGQKPLTLTIDEGKHLIKAVRDHKIVFQTGSQQRSDRSFRLACELVRNGRIGKLQNVNVYVPAGLTAGPFRPGPIPAGLNWDFWLGQAPKVEYLKERCHSTFRWWFEYSGGPMTDWGAHHNDIARWALGLDGPVAVEGKALTQPIEGGYNTPSDFEVTFTWGNGVKHVVKTTKDDSPFGAILKEDGQRNGIKFEGTEGWIWVNRSELSASKDEIYKTPLPDNAVHLEVSRDHAANFFECVKSRKDPIAHVEVGHRSASVCHLSVIAVRLGRKLQWDPIKEQFTGDGAAEGNAMVVREMRKPYDYTMVS
jgi:predicted dehydrogenase